MEQSLAGRKRLFGLVLFLVFPLACSQKSVQMDEPIIAPSPDLRAQALPKDEEPQPIPADALKTIYFEYDMSRLNERAKKTLQENAAWLKAHPEVTIQIEGHCDERGTQEYNINLGEKRARKTKEYLESLGIEGGRMSTISYGAEPGQAENLWAENRKAVFLILSGK